ncbi:CACTA en-spm transposon protein [Cucumis melo var. makuwa]|uniref:CACTA en-spm transposon protein n=1 Tax=Cucumis melo var. makuwa TaxID=1194695 RepID=A0A5D3C8D2_CUCMM|nr:CACTA en-spm transposon protein [Cucumis melo var. makuwa]
MSLPSGFHEADMYLELDDAFNNAGGLCPSTHSHFEEMLALPELGVGVFELDFGDQALTYFVEHQMLSMWKEYKGENHQHFKQFSDSKEARAIPPTRLVNRVKDWHFLCDHYMTCQFHEQSRVNKSQPSLEGLQPSSGDEICETVLGRRPGYSKSLGWGPKPKSRKSTTSSSSSSYDEMHSREISELKASLGNSNCLIDEQRIREEEHDR